MKNLFSLLLLILCCATPLLAATLEVGPGKPYANPAQASQDAQPGDTILIFPATYTGTFFIENLAGNADQWVTFRGVDKNSVVFQGGTEALHFIDVAYIRIERITITGQSGNGINIDDGGSFDTPAHHIVLYDIAFHDMGAQGNNDMLKLSGLDQFEISHCTFLNGAEGGSGIDMVGCHWGNIHHCSFEQMGSNSIQAKGGTQYLRIANNWFVDGGQRSLNLGGSTGLQFFRPQDATFEAADIQVYANILLRSWAPVAYVGSVRVDVANNTILYPENWIIRILQETVDPTRFSPCGQNWFRNNIIYYSNSLSTDVNIGPNTAPETFIFSNNLWYNADAPGNSQPNLPVAETAALIGQDPLFLDLNSIDVHLGNNSPALAAGTWIDGLGTDLDGFLFNNPPTLGAYELNPASSVEPHLELIEVKIYPNPAKQWIKIEVPQAQMGFLYKITDMSGRLCSQGHAKGSTIYLDISEYQPGPYKIQLLAGNKSAASIFIKTK